jgi:hypothetical protein
MRRLAWLGVVAIGAAASGSCGGKSEHSGGSGGGGTSPGSVATYPAFLQSLVGAYCQEVIACPQANDDTLALALVAGTAARCSNYFGQTVPRQASTRDLEQAISDGRVRFDAQRAAACVAAIQGAANPSAIDASVCSEVTQGTIALGAACYRDEECVPVAYCASPTFGACPGTCTAKLPAGSPCQESRECDAAGGMADCDSGTGTQPTCVALAVVTGAAAGAACGRQPGNQFVACTCGLWCSTDGTCRAPIPVGQVCTDSDDACAAGSMCVLQTDGTRLCQSITVVGTAGGACDETADMPTHVCDPFVNLTCTQGQCQRLGDGTQGSPCDTSDYGDTSCNEGLYCNSSVTPHVCAPLEPAGTVCHSSAECAGSCNFATSQCSDRYCSL